MSAPAPALAKVQRRVVVVRLADAAESVTVVSVAFWLSLIFFPVSFPHMIVRSWEHGNLLPAMVIFTLLLDAFLYLRVAHMLSARPGAIAAACLGSLPVLIVGGLSLVLQSAVSHTLSADLPNLQARVAEEILAHTYLGLVAGVFLPFLLIRLMQQVKAADYLFGVKSNPMH